MHWRNRALSFYIYVQSSYRHHHHRAKYFPTRDTKFDAVVRGTCPVALLRGNYTYNSHAYLPVRKRSRNTSAIVKVTPSAMCTTPI